MYSTENGQHLSTFRFDCAVVAYLGYCVVRRKAPKVLIGFLPNVSEELSLSISRIWIPFLYPLTLPCFLPYILRMSVLLLKTHTNNLPDGAIPIMFAHII